MRLRIVLAFIGVCCASLSAWPAADDFLHTGIEPSYIEIYLKRFPPKLAEKAFVVKPIELKDDPAFTPVRLTALPNFSDDMEVRCTKSGKVHSCGLLATINGEEFSTREIEGTRRIRLPAALTGFHRDISACVLLQPGKAPLAVPVLGFCTLCDGKSAKAYIHDLYKAGNHVLCVDSIVTNGMNEASGHGVSGQVIAEAAAMGRVIDGFLKLGDDNGGQPIRNRVTSVRLLGTSWGGMIAMHMLRLPQAASWPVDRTLIASIPVNLRTTALLLDKYQREDRNRTSIFQLAKLRNGFTPDSDFPSTKEQIWMRAGVGYAFHGDLTKLAEENIKRYMPDLMDRLHRFEDDEEVKQLRKQYKNALKDRQEEEERLLKSQKDQMDKRDYEIAKDNLDEYHKAQRDYAKRELTDLGDWSFKHMVFLLVRPYWSVNGDASDIGRLDVLLQGAPNFVQVVNAEDDPLNTPEDVAALKKQFPEQIIWLPHGGHLGYTGTNWFQAMIGKFFK